MSFIHLVLRLIVDANNNIVLLAAAVGLPSSIVHIFCVTYNVTASCIIYFFGITRNMVRTRMSFWWSKLLQLIFTLEL